MISTSKFQWMAIFHISNRMIQMYMSFSALI